MDCNERGFQLEDVKAICSVGKSTKGVEENGKRGYIGEKGIGFKSVFKVAERVYIYSHPFYFKFDRRKELGMITPYWVQQEDRLPVPSEGFQTTIILLPPGGTTFEPLFGDFREISPTLLLFLNKLKKMQINISPRIRLTTKEDQGREFAKLEVNDSTGTMSVSRYRLFDKTWSVRSPNIEERRRGVEKTEVRLAFPVDDSNKPLDEAQRLHAFLPVRDFGFKVGLCLEVGERY